MLPGKEQSSDRQSLPNEVERLPGGVTVEWYCDRQIACFTAPDSARLTIQSLFDRAEVILHDWPADTMHLNILDFSSGQVASTPYARERAQVLMALRPDLNMATAFVLPPSIQMRLFQLMSRTVNRPKGQMAVFESRDQAIVWLKKAGSIA